MKELQDIRNILVIDLAFIGDIILATPVTRALKEKYPNAKLTMLVVPLTKSVAEMNPYVDEVLVYDKRGVDAGPFGMLHMSNQLKSYHFDLAVSMNFALRGAIVARLAGIPNRLGYDAQHAGFFLNIIASSQREGIKHETLNHLEVLKPLGFSTEDSSLKLVPPEAVYETLSAKLKERHIPGKGVLAICPFGSYERKDLPQAAAAHVIRHYAERRPVVLIGGPAERPRLEALAELAGLPKNNILGGDLNLQELAAFLKNADCLLTADTGPLHIAQGVGCRTVAVFGPTDPKVWGPRGKEDVVLQHPYPCTPCWGKGECKHKNACIADTTAIEIIHAVGR